MARTKAKEKGAVPIARPQAAVPPRRDLRPWIYASLDVLFAVAQLVLIWKVIPNRLPSATFHLATVPFALLVMAAMMVWRTPLARKIGVAAGTVALASTVLLIVRIVVSASFLAGTYGAFGKAAAMTALMAIALLVELVALLPLVQVKYLMSRAGRRVFGAA